MFTTIAAINLLDYTLQLVAKRSKSLQTFVYDLILSMQFSTHWMMPGFTPTAYWILELLDSKDGLQQATREIVNADKIYTFQESVGKPFVALL